MFDLRNRVALITGGCGFLGVKHAEAILEFGGEVILADIHTEESRIDLINRLGDKYDIDKITSIHMDVTDKWSI
jgi:NAD(P)-dependent dehydrogenase (short-subunit alcohol dehydrogenase family)